MNSITTIREDRETLRWPPDSVPADDADDAQGTVVGDKYRLVRTIGIGGMSTVHEAKNLLLGTRVAVKVLHPQLADDAAAVERMHQEAKVGALVGHPNVVDVIDFGLTDEGAPYLVLEYLDGEPLSQKLADAAPLTPAETVQIVRQVLSALEAAHAAGVIHRDLKPENVFLCSDGRVKVLDFGIAVHRGMRRLSGELVFGTPVYMSPEQAAGRPLDARSDLYAVGVMLYEMLSGSVPFGGTPEQVVHALMTTDPPELAQIAPQPLPMRLAGIVHRAMARLPEERFGSAAELAAALEPFGPPSTLRGPRSEPVPLFRPPTAQPRRVRRMEPPVPMRLPVAWHPGRWLFGAVAIAIAAVALYAPWRDGVVAAAPPSVRALVAGPVATRVAARGAPESAIAPLDPRVTLAPHATPPAAPAEGEAVAPDAIAPEAIAPEATAPEPAAPTAPVEEPTPPAARRRRTARPAPLFEFPVVPDVPFQPPEAPASPEVTPLPASPVEPPVDRTPYDEVEPGQPPIMPNPY